LKGRRSEAAMVLDVLEALVDNGGSMLMTRLSQAANLSYAKLVELMVKLESRGVVKVVNSEGRREVYITGRGLELLRELRRLKRILDDLNINL